MNKIVKYLNETNSLGKFSKKYFNNLNSILSNIDEDEIDRLGEIFEKSVLDGSTIFVIGNGGSAATASTMANDLGFDVLKRAKAKTPFKVHSLVENNSVITAIANDIGYENIFVNQLKIHYRLGDCLIAISASGNSLNVLNAAKWVKQKGGKVIGFLGFSGGNMLDICDIKIHVKTSPGEFGPVEDAHLIINHVLAHWFQNKL
tara:strand:+ start:3760 stop:4368 length:609 start_codon:yes stop_codon:yes gene_type:complete